VGCQTPGGRDEIGGGLPRRSEFGFVPHLTYNDVAIDVMWHLCSEKDQVTLSVLRHIGQLATKQRRWTNT
jgi:hypothetical protein